MAADDGGPVDDRRTLQRLRRRLYQPDAADADREAYQAALGRVGPVAGRAGTVVRNAGDEDPAEQDPPVERAVSRRSLRDLPLRWRVVAVVGVVAAVIAVAVVVTSPAQPSLGPLAAHRTRFSTLSSTATAALPDRFGSDAVAAFFENVPSTASERTTAARKPFFGSGAGPTDFDLQQYDVGATTLSVTVVTDERAAVSAVLATRAGAAGTHRVFSAAGDAVPLRPTSAAGRIAGLETPSVLRVDVPAGTRFVVRAVFLTPIDLGTIDAG